MQSSGVKDYLKDVGRDVAGSLGDELKGVAKEKAVNFVKEQFGLGFKDELKSAGKDILGAVGDELKGAAKEKANEYIKEQLGLGMDGGAIAKPCSIPVAKLRKAVTAARKSNHITGKANREQLMTIGEGHADLGGNHADAVAKYLERSPLTVPMLREMRGLIKGGFHRPVSELSMSDLQEYIYWTAKDLGWSWSQLDGIAPKRRQPRGCRGTAAPGRTRDVPVRKKRAPSKYNLFIKKYIAEHRGDSDDIRELFTDATAAWNRGADRRDGARRGAATRAYKRATPARERKRIEQKKQTAREIYAEQGSNPKVAAIRRMKIPKRSQAGRGAAYDSGSESDE
jgi:hypothetical protein